MRKAFKFKLKPTQYHIKQFYQFAGNSRFVFNHLLEWSSQTYRKTGQNTVGRSPVYGQITALKQEFEWLKVSHVHTLQAAADDLIHGYKRFFNKQGGYPSSRTTHCCGVYLAELTLSDRSVVCPACQQRWDRDHNAALNLYHVAVGQTETLNACGDEQKTISIERAAV